MRNFTNPRLHWRIVDSIDHAGRTTCPSLLRHCSSFWSLYILIPAYFTFTGSNSIKDTRYSFTGRPKCVTIGCRVHRRSHYPSFTAPPSSSILLLSSLSRLSSSSPLSWLRFVFVALPNTLISFLLSILTWKMVVLMTSSRLSVEHFIHNEQKYSSSLFVLICRYSWLVPYYVILSQSHGE